MAVPRWFKWTLGIIVFLGMTFVALIAGGLWWISSSGAPDVAVGERLPVVDLASLTSDERIDLASYRGQVVVLDFWSSW